MAESSLRPPSHLDIIDGNISENFRKWKRQMEIFLSASGASEKSKKIQTNIILHCAGPKVIDIYDQFAWEEDGDREKPDKLFQQIEKYCNPRKNEVMESHRFWNTKMDDFSSFEQFLTELRKRVESCNFGEKDRMIRDKIVFSANGKLQELLLREEKLELEKCIQICRAYEQSNKHVKEFRDNESSSVHKVEQKQKSTNSSAEKFGAKPKQQHKYEQPSREKTKKLSKPCKFCSYKHEALKEKCPAWGKKCDSCGGRNHFKSVCKKVHAVSENLSDSDDEFWLQMVESELKSKVKAKMLVNDCEVNFQIDTGSEINTINSKFVKKSQRKKKIIRLRMWNKSTVNSLGEAELQVTNPLTGKQYGVKFIIVPNEFECLLGLKTVQKLNLVTINSENFIGKVEKDLGDLGEVKLKIEDGVTKGHFQLEIFLWQ
jgi:hypothetical protein